MARPTHIERGEAAAKQECMTAEEFAAALRGSSRIVWFLRSVGAARKAEVQEFVSWFAIGFVSHRRFFVFASHGGTTLALLCCSVHLPRALRRTAGVSART